MIWSFHNFNNHPADIATIASGDKFIDCQFMSVIDDQFTLRTRRNLEFFKCNLINVELHPSIKTNMCNTAKIEFEIDGNGEIINSTPRGKRNPAPLREVEVDDILADDTLTDRVAWANYKHRIVRSRRARGKPDFPDAIASLTASKAITVNPEKRFL